MPEPRADPLFHEAVREAGVADERAWPQSAFLGLVEIAEVVGPDDDLPADVTERDEFLCGSVDDVFLWRVGRRWCSRGVHPAGDVPRHAQPVAAAGGRPRRPGCAVGRRRFAGPGRRVAQTPS